MPEPDTRRLRITSRRLGREDRHDPPVLRRDNDELVFDDHVLKPAQLRIDRDYRRRDHVERHRRRHEGADDQREPDMVRPVQRNPMEPVTDQDAFAVCRGIGAEPPSSRQSPDASRAPR